MFILLLIIPNLELRGAENLNSTPDIAARKQVSCVVRDKDGKQEFVMSDGYRTSIIHQTSEPGNWDTFAGANIHFQSSSFIEIGPGVAFDETKKTEIVNRIRDMLSQDPKVYVLLALSINPTQQWGAQNPDHIAKQESGGNGFPSFGSLKYRRELITNLNVLTAFLRSIPEGKIVTGFHFEGGGDGQFYVGKPNFNEIDYSAGNCEDFRVFLKDIYKNNVSALQKAWDNNSVTFDNATLIKDSEVPKGANTYLYENIGIEHRAIDSLHFQHGLCVPRFIKTCGDALIKGIGKPIIVSAWRSDAFTGHAINIYGTSDILADKNKIFAVASTNQYGEARKWGNPGQMDGLWSSMGLHGQCRIEEWDYRPFGIDDGYGCESAEEYHMQIIREVGKAATRGFCGWFYEMGNWYPNGSVQVNTVKQAAKIMEWSRRSNAPITHNEMAVFVDEDAGWRKNWSVKVNTSSWDSIYNSHRGSEDALNTCGVPFDLYFLNDIANPKLPDYKIYVLLHTAVIRKEQVNAIKQKVHKAGKVLVILETAGDGSTAGIGSPDYYLNTDTLRTIMQNGPHKTIWTKSLSAKLLNSIAADAGIKTLGSVGQATFIGNGVAVVHRIVAASTKVRFSQKVNLIDIDGNTILAKSVNEWEPNVGVKRTAVVFYTPVVSNK